MEGMNFILSASRSFRFRFGYVTLRCGQSSFCGIRPLVAVLPLIVTAELLTVSSRILIDQDVCRICLYILQTSCQLCNWLKSLKKLISGVLLSGNKCRVHSLHVSRFRNDFNGLLDSTKASSVRQPCRAFHI